MYKRMARGQQLLDIGVDSDLDEVFIDLRGVDHAPSIRVSVIRESRVANKASAVHVSSGDISDQFMQDLALARNIYAGCVKVISIEGANAEGLMYFIVKAAEMGDFRLVK